MELICFIWLSSQVHEANTSLVHIKIFRSHLLLNPISSLASEVFWNIMTWFQTILPVFPNFLFLFFSLNLVNLLRTCLTKTDSITIPLLYCLTLFQFSTLTLLLDNRGQTYIALEKVPTVRHNLVVFLHYINVTKWYFSDRAIHLKSILQSCHHIVFFLLYPRPKDNT